MLITPIAKICTIETKTKQLKKGIKYEITYYNDFQTKRKYLIDPDTKKLNEIQEECKKLSYNFGQIININSSDITEFICKNFRKVFIGIEYPSQTVKISPYILGVWLGDGHSRCAGLTNIDKVIIEEWKNEAKNRNLQIRISQKKERKTKVEEYQTPFVASYHITSTNDISIKNTLLSDLKFYNLIRNKHIPEDYLKNSKEIRCELLAGLLDTDGTLTKQRYEITQKSKKLSQDIVKLCRSLGFYTNINESIKKCTNSNNKEHSGLYYRIHISVNLNSPVIPVKCDRKKIDIKKCKYIFNPKFDMKGNVVKKTETTWNDELKLELISTVEYFIKKEPGQNIPWNRFSEFNEKLSNIGSDALRTQYRDIKKSEKKYKEYLEKIIPKNFNIIEIEWIEKYNEIKQIWSNSINGWNSKSLSDELSNWFHNQTKYETLYASKKKLLQELIDLQPKTYRSILKNNLLYIKNEIIKNGKFEDVVLLKNGKLYVPSTTKYSNIGRTLSSLKSKLNNKTKFNFDNIESKEDAIEIFGSILDESHLNLSEDRRYMIIQKSQSGEGELIEHTSCAMACKNIGKPDNSKRRISKACQTGEILFGCYWYKWLDYNLLP